MAAGGRTRLSGFVGSTTGLPEFAAQDRGDRRGVRFGAGRKDSVQPGKVYRSQRIIPVGKLHRNEGLTGQNLSNRSGYRFSQ